MAITLSSQGRAENLLLVGEILHGKKIPLIGEATYKENMDKLLEY